MYVLRGECSMIVSAQSDLTSLPLLDGRTPWHIVTSPVHNYVITVSYEHVQNFVRVLEQSENSVLTFDPAWG